MLDTQIAFLAINRFFERNQKLTKKFSQQKKLQKMSSFGAEGQ